MAFLKNFFGSQKTVEVATNILNLITTVASLASNPKDIDPMLDKVRTISAQLPKESALSKKDEAVLLEVYLEIEEYLMTSDPIRTYSQQELRGKASKELLTRLMAYKSIRK